MTVSFKQLIKEGKIKRGDLLRAQHADIRVEPGFNLSIDPDKFEQLAQELAEYILAGGVIPPLLVRVADDGTLYIVDGHLRHRALAIAIERTTDAAILERLRTVSFMPFIGNDADRLEIIFTSREGRQLSDLERALGYKRFAKLGLKPEDIAERVKRSRPHVDGYLLLANANTDLQQLVQSGKVKVTAAIAAVRKHGEKAGEFLTGKRVTVSDVTGRTLPRKVVDEVEAALKWFKTEGLDLEARVAITKASKGNPAYQNTHIEIPVAALAELLGAVALIENARQAQAEKARDKAAKAAQTDIEQAAA
ncbi:ParB-like partition protein [Burkholderia phage Mica]|uniref:Putative partioning protein n=1 Tax=Burkholderia phage Mica TaxID=2767579 RepID=A0A873WBM2_9CAUD|nr:ParB-like partition protein [Burkholderia phage Mica]QPB08659.1 putative partioning protein [Burkholderia phage Mica]